MNASKFMDKQIMELSGSSQPPDKFFDLINPQEEHPISTAAGGDVKKEQQHQEPEILPSYDFHPIGSFSPPTSSGGGIGGAWPTWGSVDSKLASLNLKNAGTPEPHGFAQVGHEKEKSSYDNVIGSDIDYIVKKHTDRLMDAMEGISSKLLQLDNRTHHLENSLSEIKMTIANNNGSTDGRLSQLENILREVHAGVQVLQDKQDVVEAQLHLTQLNAPKGELQYSESSKTEQPESQQQIPPPQQLIQQSYQHTVPLTQPIMLPSASVPNASLPVQPNSPLPIPPLPQSQVPSVPSFPRDPYFPSAASQVEDPSKPFQVTAQQQQQATAPPPPLPQTYQSSQLPQYLQPPPSHQLVHPSPQSLTISPHSEESVHVPLPQNYPPSIRQPVPFPQHPSSQQFYGPNSSTYEPPTSKQSPGLPSFSSSYGPPGPNYSDSYVHTGFASSQSNSAGKPLPFASSVPPGGSSNYPRLPVARVLPQAAATGSGSSGSPGARVPIDDVIEKVTTMGFSKDQVRATVRKLTENGQSVDLNVVLDKLMNDGEIQPQKGWFGR
ncbi:protein transport protein sec31-like [Zingiber officinale]|uniref:DUF1421 domain-containing protein n=1 Tax=Zingiber officinale TaxID=94328 RepID=A0A8J5KVW5_ZINOF|nr:protein transport protein sec31-like [Zingiber officinale]KAG6495132.1 hypothetical protein ZIOFF_042923 [Zingiber officinale]